MIGFTLTISELKELPTEELMDEARAMVERECAEFLLRSLQGAQVFRHGGVLNWRELGALLRGLGSRRNGEQALLEHGYPTLLIARGDSLLLRLARPRTELHSELLRTLDHGTLYLVECWDLG